MMDDEKLLLDDEMEKVSPSGDEEFEIDEDATYEVNGVELFLSQIGQYPVYTKEEEYAAFKKYKECQDADEKRELRNDIVNHNMKLVVNIAKKYATSAKYLDLMDVVQYGSLGLFTAIDKFELEKGYKFSTYATWWIKQKITRSISEFDHPVRVPVHMNEMILKVRKFRNKYLSTNGCYPEKEYVMESLKISSDDYDDVMFAGLYKQVGSLNVVVGENLHNDDNELIDFIADEKFETPEVAAEKNDLENTINNYIEEYLLTLNPAGRERMRTIINKRYGLNGEYEHTLDDLGKEFGITRERVRQLQSKFERWMAHPNRRKKLKYYLH